MNMPIYLDNDDEPLALPYLLFNVGDNVYGINSKYVRSIETLGEVTTIVDSEPNVRGGVIYQNNFIYLLDLRKLFGLKMQIEEFDKAVQPEQRIKDHVNWISALEESVRERTEFMLSDDPHQCAFGKWYYSFKTSNNVLKHQLAAINAPHEAIHNTAKLIKKLTKEDKYDAALSAIEELRNTHYKTTMHLLSNLRQYFQDSLKEIYIVIDSVDCMKGLIVDSIAGVEYLNNTLCVPESMSSIEYFEFLGQRLNESTVVTVINNHI